jgi:sulfatase maturation enzyme AslB (radical SAM superfamily)
MKPEKNNTYCRYPFREIALKNFDGDQLTAAWPCCMMGNINKFTNIPVNLGIKNIKDLTPEEIYNHEIFENLRSNLKNGVKDPICTVCWRLEDQGLTSFRLLSDSEFHKDEDGLSAIDITTSSTCNLRCRMCTPSSSNSLLIDHRYFEKHNLLDDIKKTTKFWNLTGTNSTKIIESHKSIQWKWLMENTSKINLLRASGGESFLDKRILMLLDRYIETGNCKDTTLAFITNGTLLNNELIDKLNCFKNNFHNFSIDGTKKIYEYIRYPGSFEELDKILRNYREKIKPKNTPFIMSMIVSSLNILDVPNYIDWARSIDPLATTNFSEVYGVERGTSAKRLPIYILEHAKQSIEPYLNDSNKGSKVQIEHIYQYINTCIKNNKEDKEMMLKEIELFDRSRNQSYKDYLPDILVDWLSSK